MPRIPFKAALAALLLGIASAVQAGSQPCAKDEKEWVTVWGAMPQLTEPNNLPPPPFNETGRVFYDTTIRQTVKISLAASTLRLQISNAFGGSDLPITAVSVAQPSDPHSAGGSAIDPSTSVNVTFSDTPSFVVPNGALVVSDPIEIDVEAESILAISIYLADGQTTNDITSHPGSRTTSWLAHGEHIVAADLPDVDAEGGAATGSDHWYLISAVEAKITRGAASTVAFVGDSLTDGRGSTTNENDRWPDVLLSRLLGTHDDDDNNNNTRPSPPAHSVAILNQAAGGNRMLADGLGPNVLGRVGRDVLSHTGVDYAVVFHGVNDLGTAPATEDAQAAVAERLVAAYKQLATRLRGHGVAVFGATITPMTGPGQEYGQPEREAARQVINEWIRGADGEGFFDAVLDFDEIVRDPENPERLAEAYDEGDHLHLNPEGYRALAEGVDLELFETFRGGVRR